MLDTSTPFLPPEPQRMQVSTAHGRCSFCHAVSAGQAHRGDGRLCAACVTAVVSLISTARSRPRAHRDRACALCRAHSPALIRGRVNAWSCADCISSAARLLEA